MKREPVERPLGNKRKGAGAGAALTVGPAGGSTSAPSHHATSRHPAAFSFVAGAAAQTGSAFIAGSATCDRLTRDRLYASKAC